MDLFKSQSDGKSSSLYSVREFCVAKSRWGTWCFPSLSVRKETSLSVPGRHSHWPSVVCAKQKTNKQQSHHRPPPIFTLCGLQTIPTGDTVCSLNDSWNAAYIFNILMWLFLISYNPGQLYLTVVSCVLELNLCIAILTGFTDFVLKSGFRKNKVSLHPTLTQFGVSVHHQVKVGPFENTSGPELCLVFIYSGIRLAQTWPGVVSKCASLSWNCKKQKRKTFPA